MNNIWYSVKRLQATAFDADSFLDEEDRFKYIFDKEVSRINHHLHFVPHGISCQIDGITHYTPRKQDVPQQKHFHNLIKVNHE